MNVDRLEDPNTTALVSLFVFVEWLWLFYSLIFIPVPRSLENQRGIAKKAWSLTTKSMELSGSVVEVVVVRMQQQQHKLVAAELRS